MSNFYAVELYSVRDELKKDLWGTLRRVAKMGYDGVEFFGDFTHTAQELRAALDDTGLVCCGWHTPWPYVSPSNLLGTVTYNKIIGNTDIIIPGLPKEMTDSKAAWLKTAEAFEAVADKLADYGMFLGYHNHSQEFVSLEGDIPFHYLFDNAPSILMQLDNGNALSAGPDVDIFDPLSRYAGRAKTVHLKPYSRKDGYATMIGEDDIDLPRFFAECEQYHDVEWYIVEYECQEKYSQFEGVERCINALLKMESEGLI